MLHPYISVKLMGFGVGRDIISSRVSISRAQVARVLKVRTVEIATPLTPSKRDERYEVARYDITGSRSPQALTFSADWFHYI